MAPALRMTRSIKEKLPVFFIRYWAIFEVLRLLAIYVVGRVSVRNRQKSPFLFFFYLTSTFGTTPGYISILCTK